MTGKLREMVPVSEQENTGGDKASKWAVSLDMFCSGKKRKPFGLSFWNLCEWRGK